MKVTLINTHDNLGGAARAAYRLHRGLSSIGIDSEMIVRHKRSDDTSVKVVGSRFSSRYMDKLYYTMDLVPYVPSMKRPYLPWSVGWFGSHSVKELGLHKSDIVNLHWISRGFLSIKDLSKINKPMVWTLHDMWPFTGGCHYSSGCQKYIDSCGACPKLTSGKENDITRWVWKQKNKYWANINLSIVTPSTWLADCAIDSSLFYNRKIMVIPNGLNTEAFKPITKSKAREALRLPKQDSIILMGAMSSTSDRRKGFQFLQPALQKSGQSDKLNSRLVVFGSKEPANPPDIGMESSYLGKIENEASLSNMYSSADVFVAPSLEENLSNMVMEAMACGTPCVAFDIGGMPDMIEHKVNGYLAKPYETDDLAQGIKWVIEDRERNMRLSENARKKVENEFSLEKIARRYGNLFQELIDSNKGRVSREYK